ncbi:MAG: Nucleotidyltransferase domain protein [Anaerolineae bacterium]|nr:MAG: Nucleotidyltransferase domain protein [Anaerolineae bacterium]
MSVIPLPPPVSVRKRIPMRVIRAVVDHIAKTFQPEKIILFGSYAYGKPTPGSDIDLLVIMDSPRDDLETALEIRRSFPLLNFGLDIIVRSSETIELRKQLGDWFLIEVTERGKILYERPDR